MNRRQFALSSMAAASASGAATGALTKIKDLNIYTNDQYYCSFPSIVRRASGELIVAFRRAPNRRLIGEMGYSHTDSNSYCVLVRSRDNGETWTKEPELIYAHPWGGSQDPCIVQLR
ncbi:MAG: exo-alpha-sialidase, partial [Bryobacterales bacterium]|nr:exo-alpha-sialidase [Bryobacterales bacterium]